MAGALHHCTIKCSHLSQLVLVSDPSPNAITKLAPTQARNPYFTITLTLALNLTLTLTRTRPHCHRRGGIPDMNTLATPG